MCVVHSKVISQTASLLFCIDLRLTEGLRVPVHQPLLCWALLTFLIFANQTTSLSNSLR
jgi:hypothetical protein